MWIPMADGVRLSARLFLPDTDGPWPALLEALPYRKDDLTASYSDEYRRLRDEGDFAVARLDLRGTGASEGIATDEYPPEEQTDLAAVIAWLADSRVVQRQGRDVRHLVLGLQLAAGRRRAAAGTRPRSSRSTRATTATPTTSTTRAAPCARSTSSTT